MMLTSDQLQVLRAMYAHPDGENPQALPPDVAGDLERQGMIRFSRVTRHARLSVYSLTGKGKRAIMGAENQ
jgi:DNA-binding MarR family transcriptional regulator